MDNKDLIRMANQIAGFFAAYPEEEAVKEIANHLAKFWDPRMRADLGKHLRDGGKGLEPLALKAANLVCIKN